MSRTLPRALGDNPANCVSLRTFMAEAGDTAKIFPAGVPHSSAPKREVKLASGGKLCETQWQEAQEKRFMYTIKILRGVVGTPCFVLFPVSMEIRGRGSVTPRKRPLLSHRHFRSPFLPSAR